jgi:hypothetical protein
MHMAQRDRGYSSNIVTIVELLDKLTSPGHQLGPVSGQVCNARNGTHTANDPSLPGTAS